MTWSSNAKEFFRQHGRHLRRRTEHRWVRACAPYGFTYSLDLHAAPEAFQADLLKLARALLALRLGRRLVLLRDLFNARIDRVQMHTLLAWMRAAIVELQHDGKAALYTPPSPDPARDNEFLLHADLFAAERVLLVFDDVPSDGSGRSLLLPLDQVALVLRRAGMPASERQKALRLISGRWRQDGFDRLHSLLYGTTRPWHRAARDGLRAAAIPVAFARGEGYLLHDRLWLHGRERINGPVRTFRFHRLIHALP